jgi:hypothetical protein
MTALIRLVDALGRERLDEIVIDSLEPLRIACVATVEDDIEEARRH